MSGSWIPVHAERPRILEYSVTLQTIKGVFVGYFQRDTVMFVFCLSECVVQTKRRHLTKYSSIFVAFILSARHFEREEIWERD